MLGVVGSAVQQFTVLEVNPQGTDALGLLREAAVEARALYPEMFEHDAPWPTNGPNPVGGVYLVAYKGTSPVGCGAFRPLESGVAEIRRMFVTQAARRAGVARHLLGELEARAHKLGYTTLRLETGYKQIPAIKLYEAAGFSRIGAFGSYVGDPTSVCFEKVIRHENSDAQPLVAADGLQHGAARG
ncbi:MAG: GNAT family N-acetyltransferase [Cyanobacteriota bacterium]